MRRRDDHRRVVRTPDIAGDVALRRWEGPLLSEARKRHSGIEAG